MFAIQIPIIFILIGVISLLFPEKVGIGFCKFGKLFWRIVTFWLTDMRWFYKEEKAPKTFHKLGYIFTILGVFHLGLIVYSYFGPNYLALSRETQAYLRNMYVSLKESYNISIPIDSKQEKVIHYRYNGVSGTLIGEWSVDHYNFKNLKEK